MATRKGTSELKDLDVDRVDGVDRPATGRNFLLFKAEDTDVITKHAHNLAVAAHALLSKMRGADVTVTKSIAIMTNGLAQVLGEAPVFIGKDVPTQPYQFGEPDVNDRGPADEDLGPNFRPRSMPGSSVGAVQFRKGKTVTMEPRIADADEEGETNEHSGTAPWAADAKTGKTKAIKALMDAVKATYEADEDDEDAKDKAKAKAAKAYSQAQKAMKDDMKDNDADEDDAKGKSKRKAKTPPPPGYAAHEEPDEDDDMDASEKQNRGVARSVANLEKQMGEVGEVLKAMMSGATAIGGGVRIAKTRPRSQQVDERDGTPVTKSASGYQPKFGTDFSNIVFGA